MLTILVIDIIFKTLKQYQKLVVQDDLKEIVKSLKSDPIVQIALGWTGGSCKKTSSIIYIPTINEDKCIWDLYRYIEAATGELPKVPDEFSGTKQVYRTLSEELTALKDKVETLFRIAYGQYQASEWEIRDKLADIELHKVRIMVCFKMIGLNISKYLKD